MGICRAGSSSRQPTISDVSQVLELRPGVLRLLCGSSRRELITSAERMSGLGAMTGAAQVTVNAGSPVVGKTMRHADLHPGLLVTSVSRGERVFFPPAIPCSRSVITSW